MPKCNDANANSRVPAVCPTRSERQPYSGCQVPEDALGVPKDFPAEEIAAWSMETETPAGRLHHLRPVVRLSAAYNLEAFDKNGWVVVRKTPDNSFRANQVVLTAS